MGYGCWWVLWGTFWWSAIGAHWNYVIHCWCHHWTTTSMEDVIHRTLCRIRIHHFWDHFGFPHCLLWFLSLWSSSPWPLLNCISLRFNPNPRDHPMSETREAFLSRTFQEEPEGSCSESWTWKRNTAWIYTEALSTRSDWTSLGDLLCCVWWRRDNNILHSEPSTLFQFHLHRILQSLWLHCTIFYRNSTPKVTSSYYLFCHT